MEKKDSAVARAVYATVHEDGRSAKALAAAMGLSHQTLLNKVSLTNQTNHLKPTEMISLMRVSHDLRILHAMASEMGGQFVPGPDVDDGVDPALMNDLARMSAEFGELMKEVAQDLGDGEISDIEVARIELASDHLRKALETLLRALRLKNQLGKRARTSVPA